MKKILLSLVLSFFILGISAQETQKDTVAVMILQHMSNVIGDLTSVSFDQETSTDVTNYKYGIETKFGHNQVYLYGPDKMLIHTWGPKGHRGFWYNGELFTYYSFDENNYADVPAATTTIETIDTINRMYGITFPAADFFYPTFTIDILDQFDNIFFLGMKIVEGDECFHILASNDKMIAQFWISNDAFNLPKKFILIYKDKENMQYEATFNNWDLNPDIPPSAFDFLPPPGAQKISIMAK